MRSKGNRVYLFQFGITFLIMFFVALVSMQTEAATSFTDDFSGGINTDHWSVTAGAYTIDDTQGDIRISKPAGGGAWAQVFFDHDLYGDFDVSVDYSDAVLAGCQNQIQLNLIFGGQYVADRRENWCASQYSVWLDPGGTVGVVGTADTSGTLRVTRVGSTVTFYANGSQIYQGTFNNSPVTDLWLSLQNNGTADAISVTFDNFSITADSMDGICTAPPSNMLSWWKGEDNADDSKGTNNGTMMNGATYDVGKVGQTFSFDGVDDYVNLSGPIPDMTESTITVWTYYTGGSNVGTIFMDATSAGGNDFLLDMTSSAIGINANKSGADSDYEGGNAVTGLDLGNAWHFLAWTMSPTESRIYVDGNLVKTIDKGGSNVGYHAANPSIGRWWDENENKKYFSGLIDELALFSRALSADEIAAIYNAGSGGTCLQQYNLAITKEGTGTGTVTSDPEGIDCNSAEPTNIALNKPITALTNTVTGSPDAVNDGDAGNVWYSWQSCPTSNNSFMIDLESSKTVKEIHFFPAQLYTYTIWTSDDGDSWTERHADSGDPFFPADWITIAVDGAYSARYIKYEGINNGCGYVGMVEFEVYESAAVCSLDYNSGKVVTLTATPDAGSFFSGWSGDEDCSDGEVTMDSDKTCTAEFNLITEPMPDLTGYWENPLTDKCKEKKEGLVCKVKGRFILTNNGEADARDVMVRFYLSDDDTLDEGDILLGEGMKDFVAVGKLYKKSFSLQLPVGMSLEGRYIIVYIDADNTNSESNESNNFVVYGEDE